MEGLPCQVKICAMNVSALTLGFGGPKTRSKLFSRLSDFDQIAAIKMLIFSVNLGELTFAEEGHITESFGVEEPLERGEYVGFI